MNIGERIKNRREELGLSQDELAKKMGYTSRSTINKVEKGINDVTQTNVVKYAKALDTTVAYLMGWDESERLEYMNEDIANLIVRMRENGATMTLIKEYLRLSPQRQEVVLNLVHSMLPDEHPSLLHTNNPEHN